MIVNITELLCLPSLLCPLPIFTGEVAPFESVIKGQLSTVKEA